MKKIILLTLAIIVILGVFKIVYKKNPEKKQVNVVPQTNLLPTLKKTTSLKIQKSIFLPSWQVTKDKKLNLEDYDRILYFGLTPDSQGVVEDDAFNKLKYLDSISAEKILVIKMIDDNVNESILKNTDVQNKLIDEAVNIANEYKFSEISLDIELFSLFQDQTKKQINEFVNKFYTIVKGNHLRLSLILYGDVFYRKRPFDLEFLSKNTDGIFIMAYDFHKSKGEPGPNFPFSGKQKYGYDFQQMIDDYLVYFSEEKITMIFGMYGYEWLVDEKKRPIRQAKALTYNEIKKQFLDKCEWQDCIIKRDDLAKEMEVNYITSEIVDNVAQMNFHIVWFEDNESVKIKTQFLEEKGIGNTAFWAYGYF